MSLIAEALALFLLLIFVASFLVLVPSIRLGRGAVTLRRLTGYDAARAAVARAAEEGGVTHVSPGAGTVADNTSGTPQTLAGLYIMGRMARNCASSAVPMIASVGGALALPLAENEVRAGYAEVGRLDEVPSNVRLLAQRDPLAYAAAAGDVSEFEGVNYAVLVGGWGPEYLLVGEAQARAGVQVVAGATDPAGLAAMSLTAKHTLIGEEIFVAGGYLDANPSHQAGILAQDIVRRLLIALILLGALWATLTGIDWLAALGVSR
ncbi:MAG: DUF6754 domain-containing protein [Chloroflexia bacterium]